MKLYTGTFQSSGPLFHELSGNFQSFLRSRGTTTHSQGNGPKAKIIRSSESAVAFESQTLLRSHNCGIESFARYNRGGYLSMDAQNEFWRFSSGFGRSQKEDAVHVGWLDGEMVSRYLLIFYTYNKNLNRPNLKKY
jgi:hypothetical protein